MVQITTTDEFEAWLETQGQQVHIRIATRAALRSFPFVLGHIPNTTKEDDYKTLALLDLFRNR